jgi:hypothetical protein
VQGETKERWQQLCQQAATEQDPERLLLLVEEITELLQKKQARLYQQRLKPQKSDTHDESRRA